MKSSPSLLQLEKACLQQQRPVQPIYVYTHTPPYIHRHTHTRFLKNQQIMCWHARHYSRHWWYTSQQDRKISRLSCKLTEIYGIISAGAKYYVENKTGWRSKMDWTSYFRLCDWKNSSGKCCLNEIWLTQGTSFVKIWKGYSRQGRTRANMKNARKRQAWRGRVECDSVRLECRHHL